MNNTFNAADRRLVPQRALIFQIRLNHRLRLYHRLWPRLVLLLQSRLMNEVGPQIYLLDPAGNTTEAHKEKKMSYSPLFILSCVASKLNEMKTSTISSGCLQNWCKKWDFNPGQTVGWYFSMQIYSKNIGNENTTHNLQTD